MHLIYNRMSVFRQFNGIMLKLAKASWLFVKGQLSKSGQLNLNNRVVVTKICIMT